MRALTVLGGLLFLLALTVGVNGFASPIDVPPSQIWDGNDGPWSSFFLRLGNPQQVVRVLVSTSGLYVVAILTDACNTTANVQDCTNTRGLTFNTSKSMTWKGQGPFELDQQNNLGIAVNGDFGLEQVGLGIVDDANLTLSDQVISGINATDFYVGSLGLGTQPTNFSSFADPKTSLLATLRDRRAIPSLSWSYTAGAPYRLTKVLGSLVLGGYDTSRFTPTGHSIPMSPDISRDLVVGLQQITSIDKNGKNTTLMSTGILTFVDSTLPYIWLPVEACQSFERELGLTWNATAQLYLVNDSLHNSLKEKNLQFAFKLGTSKQGGESFDIVLPYDSFDLLANPPLVANATRYFPLKRAANDTQYTLGRAFLQEAYLIADYERGNFSLSQCTFVSGAKSTIVPILPTTSLIPKPSSNPSAASSSGLGGGAIAGIVLALVGGLSLVAAVAFFFLTSRRRKRAKPKEGFVEMEGAGVRVEAAGAEPKDGMGELEDAEVRQKSPTELDTGGPGAGFYSTKSVADQQTEPQELPSQSHVHEMFDESVFSELEDTAGMARAAPGPAIADLATKASALGLTGLASPIAAGEPMTPLPSYQERPAHDRLWSAAGPAAEPIMEDPREYVPDQKQPLEHDTQDSATTAVAGDGPPPAGDSAPADSAANTVTTTTAPEPATEDPVSAESEPLQDPATK